MVALGISAPAGAGWHRALRNNGINMGNWEFCSTSPSQLQQWHRMEQLPHPAPTSRPAMAGLGLNTHNGEEQSQQLPWEKCSSL